MSEITTRRPGNCRRCQRSIPVGEKVNWTRGEGITCLVPCEPKPRETADDTELLRAVVQLEKLEREGSLNSFTQSLYDQYQAKGYLSPKQVAAVVSKIKASPLPGPDVVPAGRYALEREADGVVYFVRVWRGSRNPNIARAYLIAGSNEHLVKTADVLRAVEKVGAAEAARRYGREIGCCSICNAQLTNNLSRVLSIGPVCGGRFYDEATWKEMRRRTRSALRARGIDPAGNAGDSIPEQLQLEVT